MLPAGNPWATRYVIRITAPSFPETESRSRVSKAGRPGREHGRSGRRAARATDEGGNGTGGHRRTPGTGRIGAPLGRAEPTAPVTAPAGRPGPPRRPPRPRAPT